MAYTTIDDPSAYFQTDLFTGNATDDTAYTLDGNSDMQPDWIWIKNRTDSEQHRLMDSVRGASKVLKSSDGGVEEDVSTHLKSFDSDGFTLGTDNAVNGNTDSMVAWCWKESATAGFDIVSYTGNSSVRTISHNCGAIPKMMIVKKRSDADNWSVYHQATGAGNFTILNTTAASAGSSTMWNNTTPTSSVFSLGNKGEVNANTQTFIAYLFADVQGYSKFGSYVGNGNADGPFIYTGFKPAFVMAKRSNSASSGNWNIRDSKRSPSNVASQVLEADSSAAEGTATGTLIDMYSNGFKPRNGGSGVNAGSSLYIYMAFSENPFVTSTGVPATAR